MGGTQEDMLHFTDAGTENLDFEHMKAELEHDIDLNSLDIINNFIAIQHNMLIMKDTLLNIMDLEDKLFMIFAIVA